MSHFGLSYWTTAVTINLNKRFLFPSVVLHEMILAREKGELRAVMVAAHHKIH